MNKYLITFTVYDGCDNTFICSNNCILESEKIDENFIDSIKQFAFDKYTDKYNYYYLFVVINNIIKLDE